MTTDARDRYLDMLLSLAGKHNGPLSDLTPVLERCDVLTGLELEPRQLTGGTAAIQGSTPAIEHGSGQQAGDGASVARVPTVPAGPEHREPVAAPDPLPAAREVRGEDERAEATPPPASPEPIPAEPYGLPRAVVVRKPRDKTTVEMPCACGCGFPLHIPRWEIARDPEKKFFRNREHYHAYQRSPEGSRRASEYGGIRVDKTVDISPAPADVAQVQQPETNARTFPIDEDAHREAAAVMDALFAPSIDVPACDCPEWLRGRTLRFKADEANEAHRDECPMFKKGGHYYPLAAQSNGEGVYASTCAWCGEKRDFTPYANATEEAQQTPSISPASAKAKSTICPKCGGHYASLLHRTACLPRHAGAAL